MCIVQTYCLVTHSCCDAEPKRIHPHPSACLPVWIHLRVQFEKYFSPWYYHTGYSKLLFFGIQLLKCRDLDATIYLLSASQFSTWSERTCTQAHFHEFDFLAFIFLFFPFFFNHVWTHLLVQQSCWILMSHQLRDTSRNNIWYSRTQKVTLLFGAFYLILCCE